MLVSDNHISHNVNLFWNKKNEFTVAKEALDTEKRLKVEI